MTEQFLDGADVRSPLEQVRGERMPDARFAASSLKVPRISRFAILGQLGEQTRNYPSMRRSRQSLLPGSHTYAQHLSFFFAVGHSVELNGGARVGQGNR